MANVVLLYEQYLQEIANAIRNRKGSSNTYTPGEMAKEILAISGTALDILVNPGGPNTMLEGTEMLNSNGRKVTGIIKTKTENDIAVNKNEVTIPAGYYSVDTLITVDDGNIDECLE